jgi:hypothetical protein
MQRCKMSDTGSSASCENVGLVHTDARPVKDLMPRKLTRKQAQAYRDRWRLVNAREQAELRSTPIDVKLQQFNTLMAWAREFGWLAELGKGEAQVRERWARLRKALRG